VLYLHVLYLKQFILYPFIGRKNEAKLGATLYEQMEAGCGTLARFNKRWYGATAGSMKVHKLELRGTIEVSQSLRCSESAGYNFPSARHVVSSCDGGTSF